MKFSFKAMISLVFKVSFNTEVFKVYLETQKVSLKNVILKIKTQSTKTCSRCILGGCLFSCLTSETSSAVGCSPKLSHFSFPHCSSPTLLFTGFDFSTSHHSLVPFCSLFSPTFLSSGWDDGTGLVRGNRRRMAFAVSKHPIFSAIVEETQLNL